MTLHEFEKFHSKGLADFENSIDALRRQQISKHFEAPGKSRSHLLLQHLDVAAIAACNSNNRRHRQMTMRLRCSLMIKIHPFAEPAH
jgi:hypothetical protein